MEIPYQFRHFFETGGWRIGQRAAAGEAIRDLAEHLAQILRETRSQAGEEEGWEWSKGLSYSGLIAGNGHLAALGTLFHEEMSHSHAVLALIRAAVESFGRVWRLLESDDPDARNALAGELRSHEVARAMRKGMSLAHSDGSPLTDFDPSGKEQNHLDSYTRTAVTVMRAGGASEELAVGHYSMMSSIAHGESLGIESLNTMGYGGLQYELDRHTAGQYVRDAVGSGGVTMLRYVQLFYPELEDRWRAAVDECLLRLRIELVD